MRGLLFTLFLLAATSVQAQTKVGYTNVELIMYYMPEAKSASAALEEFKKVKAELYTKKQTRYAELIEEYQEKAGQPNFSGSQEETDLMNEASKLEKEIKETETSFEFEVTRKQAQLLEPVMNKLQEAIDAVAVEEGYTYILNQTSGSNILYGVEQFDVTKKIAAKLSIEIPDE